MNVAVIRYLLSGGFVWCLWFILCAFFPLPGPTGALHLSGFSVQALEVTSKRAGEVTAPSCPPCSFAGGQCLPGSIKQGAAISHSCSEPGILI